MFCHGPSHIYHNYKKILYVCSVSIGTSFFVQGGGGWGGGGGGEGLVVRGAGVSILIPIQVEDEKALLHGMLK